MRWPLLLVVALTASTAMGQVNLKKVLLSGEEAPDMDPGTLVTYARPLGMGAGGHFVLTANTDYFGTNLAVGYRGTLEDMNLWFRSDGTHPSGISPDIAIYGVQRMARITPTGGAIAFCLLQGPSLQAHNNRAMYVVHPDGSMQLALRDGQAAPGWGDSTGVEFGTPATYFGLYTFTITDDLRFLKPVMVEGETVLYGGPAHDPHIQIRVGALAPGIPGATVTDVSVISGEQNVPKVAGAGKIILQGTIAGPGIDTSNDKVLWGGELGALQVLLREGDPVPGLHPGNRTTIAGDAGWHNVNAAGQSLLWSRLAAGLGDTTHGVNDGVVQTGTPGNLSVAVRKGDQVPGLPAGVVFGDVAYGHIGNGGVVGLMTALAGPGIASANNNDSAILTGLPGALTVRMREGQQVPGLPPNYVYGDPNLTSDRVFFNRVGAFVARVAIKDVAADEYIDSIIYWPPGDGDPTVVLRNDEPIEVVPGDLREFFRAVPYGLSDNGEMLIHVRFDEEDEMTGVFIATVGTPTESCCRGTTCLSVTAGACTGSVAGSMATVVGSCGNGGSIATCCFADFNHDGSPSIDDLFLYLNAYFTGLPWANVGGDGVEAPTIDDLFLYINAYFTGCQ